MYVFVSEGSASSAVRPFILSGDFGGCQFSDHGIDECPGSRSCDFRGTASE